MTEKQSMGTPRGKARQLLQETGLSIDNNNFVFTFGEWTAIDDEVAKLEAALERAFVLLEHADFKNGNTDPSGVIDEGEVYAGRLMDKLIALAPESYAEVLKKT